MALYVGGIVLLYVTGIVTGQHGYSYGCMAVLWVAALLFIVKACRGENRQKEDRNDGRPGEGRGSARGDSGDK